MPGWYIHLEAARDAAQRLRAVDLPPEYGLEPTEAIRLGELAHTWRNYLAAGSVGPDLFFLLPDFKQFEGLIGVADWVLGVWEVVEREFLDPWDKWMGPVGANNSDIAAGLTGGLSKQIGAALDDVAGIINNAVLSGASRVVDVFSLLTSGVPAGYDESTFFWSDMLHYRRSYDVPFELYQRARAAELAATDDGARLDAQTLQAFALGWTAHCATDVVGHAFTNAKSGGPFRLHWQRHKVVESHFDSHAYAGRHGADSHYDTIGTSALHFRLAWRKQPQAPYTGRQDAPAYDYFATFPPYPLGSTAIDGFSRSQHFSMAPATMPAHLKRALREALEAVYATPGADITPQILENTDPAFSDAGRPTDDALDVMWSLAFRYLANMTSSGFSLKAPSPPTVINSHPFPTPPGGSSMAADPDRGADLDENITLLDVLLAIFAWILFIGQVVLWIVTILPALVVDVATFPAREVLHYAVVAPLHSLYLCSRRLLVMTGFLVPEPFEVDRGLVTLGRSSVFFRDALLTDLDDPTGFAGLPTGSDEPSGRPSPQQARHADPAYPRDTPRDPLPVLDQLLAVAGLPPLKPGNGIDDPFSEFVFPWRYPDQDVQGLRIGWEASLTHAGPYLIGQDANVLLDRQATDTATAAAYEAASVPEETETISATALPADQHLGSPVDYTLYLVSQFANGRPVPSFNLDSDRGYAWRCWDWNRHVSVAEGGNPIWQATPLGVSDYRHTQPCTAPAAFDPYTLDQVAAANPPVAPQDIAGQHRFSPTQRRLVHYLDEAVVSCGDAVDAAIDPDQILSAGLPPDGEDTP